jgi:hypothetical protein
VRAGDIVVDATIASRVVVSIDGRRRLRASNATCVSRYSTRVYAQHP